MAAFAQSRPQRGGQIRHLFKIPAAGAKPGKQLPAPIGRLIHFFRSTSSSPGIMDLTSGFPSISSIISPHPADKKAVCTVEMRPQRDKSVRYLPTPGRRNSSAENCGASFRKAETTPSFSSRSTVHVE
jgi:hypothetical protein